MPDPYATAVLADSPVAYWRLDELSGTTATSLVGGYVGTIIGGPTLNQPGALITGNAAMAFDGVDDRITVPKAAYSAFGTGPATWECWVKVPSTPAATVWFMDCALASTNGAGVQFWYDGATVAAKAGYTTGAGQITTPLPANWYGNWHHVVGVLTRGTPDTLWLYLNGTLRNSAAMPIQGADITAVSLLSLGTYPGNAGPGNWLNGLLDEVAIYNTALSPTRIAAHTLAAMTSELRQPYSTKQYGRMVRRH